MVKAKSQFKIANGDKEWSLQADSPEMYQKVRARIFCHSQRPRMSSDSEMCCVVDRYPFGGDS